jgi:hypothetical protein
MYQKLFYEVTNKIYPCDSSISMEESKLSFNQLINRNLKQHNFSRRSTMKKMNIRKFVIPISIISMILVLSLSSCLIIDPGNQVNNTNYTAREAFDFDIAVKYQKHIEIEGINGPITITGKTGISTVKIWGEKVVGSDSYEDAEAHLKYLEVQISDKTEKISIETDQPSVTHGRNYQVIYNVIVPDNWDIAIANVNGRVKVDSLNGNVSIGLVNGDVVLTEILGNVCVGVTNGTVYSKVALPLNGLCMITTVNGQIQLNIPSNTSAELAAKVTNGTVNVSNLILKNMVSSRNSVSGVLGNGQGTISVESVNGTISVSGF